MIVSILLSDWFDIILFTRSGPLCFFKKCSARARGVTAVVLALNMLEAVAAAFAASATMVRRRAGAHALNACAGAVLVCFIFRYRAQGQGDGDDECAAAAARGLFWFPLPTPWVMAYTAWNAAFSYGFGYSASTRLMLVTALAVSHGILGVPGAWLGCRCLSMVANMALRATSATYLYRPGCSFVTHK